MEVGLEFGYALAALVSSLATIATVWFKGKIKERKNKVFNYDPNLHSNVMTALEYMKA